MMRQPVVTAEGMMGVVTTVRCEPVTLGLDGPAGSYGRRWEGSEYPEEPGATMGAAG